MYLQIFPLDQFIAKRWFYFPLAGLLGLVGIALNLLSGRIKISKILTAALIFIIFIFGLKTYTMNTYWKSDNVLKEHLLQK